MDSKYITLKEIFTHKLELVLKFIRLLSQDCILEDGYTWLFKFLLLHSNLLEMELWKLHFSIIQD